MIKFFQKLKAKKGFTLVELIVVIAIIGVLAAILIPTMLGYVTSSRVQSANSTAAEIKNMVNNFITDMDTKGYTFDRANPHEVTIKVNAAAAATEGEGGSGATADAQFDTGSFKSDLDLINKALSEKVDNDFSFTKCYAVVYIDKGKVLGCAYSSDGIDISSVITADSFKGKQNEFAGWSDTDGVLGGTGNTAGLIVGTAPQLTKKLGSGSSES